MNRKIRFLSVLTLILLLIGQTLFTGISAAAKEADTPEKLYDNGLSKTVEGGAILHCWCWSFNTIRESIPEIAAAGFSSIQTSPICEVYNGGDGSLTIVGGDNWWWHYQPSDYRIGNYQLGTIEEFKAMCDTAHEYGVKVIVDSVLNHTTAYYDGISENIKNLPGNPFHPMGDERTEDQQWSETDRFEETQYDLSGLYDLNTKNKAVQEYILAFLKTCVENGADGFRYDAAKLIELPDDTSSKYGSDFASDFWPTILQNGASFQYGEVLQEGGRHQYRNSKTGYNDNDSSRLSAYHSQSFTDKGGNIRYMNTTNSFTGFRIRDAIRNKNLTADFISDALLPEGAKADQTVTWVESHDNYCNDQSYKELTEVQQVIQGWAAIAARKDGTPLFFDRPNNSSASNPWGDNKIGPEGSDMYKDPQVAAVNFFRNEMGDSPQRFVNPIEDNRQVLMIERGEENKGCVIINASDEDVVLSAATEMQDGSYTDQAFKSSFEVKDGVLSGTVKAGKVAVVYQPTIAEEEKETFAPAVNLSQPSGYFLTDALSVDVTVRSCDHARYTLVIDGNAENTLTADTFAGDTVVIENIGHNETAVLTLTGYDEKDHPAAEITREYTRWVKKDNTVVYLDPFARPEWNQFNVYIWGTAENAGWPGDQAEPSDFGLYRYILPYQYEIDGSQGNVIFNNGGGQQFDAGQILPGQQMIYTSDGRWIAYSQADYEIPYVSLTPGSGYLSADEPKVWAIVRNCDSASYTITVNDNSESAVSGSVSGGKLLPLNSLKHNDRVTITLTGYNADGKTLVSVSESYTVWQTQENTVIYMEQAAKPDWTDCYAYIWGSHENAGWPGVKMEKVSDSLYRYTLPYQYEIEGGYGNVIFNNGSGQQFDAGQITPGQQMIYTADGRWIPYEEPKSTLLGDADTDGKITILDATAIQRYLASLPTGAFDYEAACVLEKKLSIVDATYIQRYLASLPSSDGIGKPMKRD